MAFSVAVAGNGLPESEMRSAFHFKKKRLSFSGLEDIYGGDLAIVCQQQLWPVHQEIGGGNFISQAPGPLFVVG